MGESEQVGEEQFEQHFEETMEIFPKVYHVKQLDEEELEMDKRIVKCSFRLNSKETIVKTPSSTRRAKAKSIKCQSNVGTLSDCLPYKCWSTLKLFM
ncbi:hypothetical protein FF38_13052 [Lucilia cuprina]|uniref:Uncharacterized protein n=1 Tax=Lucilia cuprina TaxID=7375 RepID=A0A0L0BLN2_LUCCU|nr:hypothetical protein FF38_13052 [Lucilia cuprina]